MSEQPPAAPSDAAAGSEERRVEELLRVNAGLAAELRRLTLDRAERPRSGQMTTARRLGVLLDEREVLRARVENDEVVLAQLRQHCENLEAHRDALEDEVTRLRAGLRGLLRRGRARLLSR